ncbi:MAG: DUF3303 domain-containing protein [Gemmatimonadota bacterium]
MEATRGPRPAEAEAVLAAFARWKPPAGLEFKGFYSRADRGGLAICDASSAETLFEATASWAGSTSTTRSSRLLRSKKESSY